MAEEKPDPMSAHPSPVARSRFGDAMSPERLARVRTTCLLIIAGAVVATGLYLLQPVMIPLALALVVSYMLAPLVEFLTGRLRLPRVFSVGFAVALVAGLLVGLGVIVSTSLASVLESGDAYEQALIRFGLDLGMPIDPHELRIDPRAIEEGSIGAEVLQKATDLPVGRWASSLADGIFGTLSTLSLVLLFSIFILITDSHPARRSFRGRVARRVKRYLAIKFVLSLITGVLVGAVLAVIGLDLALLIGLLTFALNFIPNIGPLIAICLPIPLLVFDAETTSTTLALAILLPSFIQFVIGAIIEPRFLGHELRLHPVSVLAALVFWGMLWGVPGLLLAVPLTTAVHIAAGETELTRPIADLLSGRFLDPTAPRAPKDTIPPAGAAAGGVRPR